MDNDPSLTSRKDDHIRINLEEDVRSGLTSGLERYRFIHQALPELDLDMVVMRQTLFGRPVKAPFLISSMTGGTENAARINRVLAEAAQETGIAMGLGSQRAMLENPASAESFLVRKYAPDILLLANLGAVQLNYAYTVDHCQRAVDLVGADALILHFNPLQEALQPEGDTRFAGLLAKIEQVCKRLSVPVIAKEVGWGFSARAARQLAEVGVAAIDVAGAGGTSWSQVEMYRIKDKQRARVAAAFQGWGIPTSESIRLVHSSVPEMLIFASGGLRDGIDIAKCIALGAKLGGMAGPFLKAAQQGTETVVDTIQQLTRELQVCMFAAGVGSLTDLQQAELIKEDCGCDES